MTELEAKGALGMICRDIKSFVERIPEDVYPQVPGADQLWWKAAGLLIRLEVVDNAS